jgi:hypothetical protein
LVTRWDVSYLLELHAGWLPVSHEGLVRLSRLAKLLLQVVSYRPGWHLRPSSAMYPPQRL